MADLRTSSFLDMESWSVCTKLEETSSVVGMHCILQAVETRAIPRRLCSLFFIMSSPRLSFQISTVALCCTAVGEEPVARQCWAPESMYLDTSPFAKVQALQGVTGWRWSARFEGSH